MDSSQFDKKSSSSRKPARETAMLPDHTPPKIGATPETMHRAITEPHLATPEAILALQRTHGNQFVQRLLKGQHPANASSPAQSGESIQRTIYLDGRPKGCDPLKPDAAVKAVQEAIARLVGIWDPGYDKLIREMCDLGVDIEVTEVAQYLMQNMTLEEIKEEKQEWNPFGPSSSLAPTNPFRPSNPFLSPSSPSIAPTNPFRPSHPFVSNNPFISSTPSLGPSHPSSTWDPFGPSQPPQPSGLALSPPPSSRGRLKPSSSSAIFETSNPFDPIAPSTTPVGGKSRAWTMPEDQIRPRALQDMERFMANPNYLFEEAERELMTEVDEKTRLIPSSVSKAAKRDEKFLEKREKEDKGWEEKRDKKDKKLKKKRDKDEKKKAKKIAKEPETEPLIAEEKVPTKGKLLIKASEKMSSAVDAVTEPVSSLYAEHYNQKYHKLEKQQRDEWMNYGYLFLNLFHKWVKQLQIDPELLWDFIDTRYPDLATYCLYGWGITERDLGIKGGEKEETEDGSGKGIDSRFRLNEREMGMELFGQSGTSSAIGEGVFGTFFKQGAPEGLGREFKANDVNMGDAGSVSQMMGMANTVPGLYGVTKTLGDLYKERAELEKNRQQLRNEEKDTRTIDQRIATVDNKIKQQWTSAGQMGTSVGVTSAQIIAEVLQFSDVMGFTGLITGPISLGMLKFDADELKRTRGQKDLLKHAQHQLAESSNLNPSFLLASKRLNKKMRDKKTQMAIKGASAATVMAGGAVALAFIITSGAFTMGIVPAALAATGAAALAGYGIKNAVQGRNRGLKHRDLHAEMISTMLADDPDLDQANELAAELALSDPQVAARYLLMALGNAQGEHRRIILDMLKAIGVDSYKLDHYRGTENEREVDPGLKIAFEDILKALKG